MSVSAALASALDRMYDAFGVPATYAATPTAEAVSVTVRHKHLGRDKDGASAIIMVRASEVADQPAYGAVFTIAGVDWSVVELAPASEGASDRQHALLCESAPRAAWRKP